MDYAALFGNSNSNSTSSDGGGFDYSQFAGEAGGDGSFDYSQFVPEGYDPNEPIAAAPLEAYFIVPKSTEAYYGVRVVTWGVFGWGGMISNAICAAVLIRSKLIKSWTYSMILSHCISDFIFCLHAGIMRFPGVIMER